MKLLYLTAGAAEMYCGSCLRDNALATALKARGHDVVLMPIYTPTTTDETNVSSTKVFFGGISVYLEQNVPLFRHTPAFMDKLWDSEWVLKLASKKQIKVDPTFLGAMTVSMLKGTDGFQKKEVRKLVDWLKHESRFDLVSLPFALLISLAKPIKDALGCPVVCTLQGEDLFLDQLREPWKSESMALIRAAVPHVDHFVAVSDYYAQFMVRYFGIPPEKISVVPLGIDVRGHDAKPVRREAPYTIGYFARIAPEKGLHVLCDAYHQLRKRGDVPPTRLVAGGYLLDEHREYLASCEARMKDWGLADHFTYAGAPDRAGKIALLQSFDVFSVPTTYADPKGLFLIEAMANGLPVVEPRHGAFPEIISRTGGGLLVTPDDPAALAEALHTLVTDRDRAAQLGRAAAAGVREHYTVAQAATKAEHIYEGVIR
ncbi:MAG: glycosyltransferase family 4 protein [Acidimicrobiia bacterium]|nr:glycosyltransferase family 4 protein [Acidimicrobiia bacterium]